LLELGGKHHELLARLRGLLPLAASMRLAAYLCLCLVPLPAAAAAPAWLIATPDETARAGAPIMLDIVKPAAQADWPDTLRLRLVRDDRALEVELAIVDPVLTEDTCALQPIEQALQPITLLHF